MEFAVPRNWQEPGPAAAAFSSSRKSSSLISPVLASSDASMTEAMSILSPPNAFHLAKGLDTMGPPFTRMAGMSNLAAAMSMPGTILSQEPSRTSASMGCALTMASTSPAMSSRVGRMYRMPSCICARPSQAPMTPNSTGVPPASTMPCFTRSATPRKLKCPGHSVLQELAIATMGLFRSSSVYAMDLNSAR